MPVKTTRARLSGGRDSRRLAGWLVALAGLLLAGMIAVAGQQQQPPPPVAEATPVPPAGDRLYLHQRDLGTLDRQPALEVRDTPSQAVRYGLQDVRAVTLAPDGARLFVVGATSLRALDAGSGQELWQVPVSDVAGASGGPSPLLASADGRRLLVLSSRDTLPFADRPVRWLQVFDPASGWRMAVSEPLAEDPADAAGGPVSLHDAGSQAVLLQAGRGLWFFDHEELRWSGRLDLPRATGDAALSADRRLLYALEQRDGVPFLAEIDLARRQAARTIQLSRGEQRLEAVAGSIKRIPASGQVAIGYWRMGTAPSDPTSSYTPVETELRLYDPATWAETERLSLTQMILPHTLSVSGDSSALRMALQDHELQAPQLASYALDGSRQPAMQPLEANHDIQALLAGPPVPPTQPLIGAQPATAALPGHAVPLSATAAGAGADSGALAIFLRSGSNGQGEMVVVDGRGETTGVLTNVQAVIERPGDLPAAIVSDDEGRLLLATDRLVPLGVAAGSAPHAALLAPDGRTIVFKTLQDPFPDDPHPANLQLVSADLASGAARRLTDADAAPGLLGGEPSAWIGAEIYFQPLPYFSGQHETWRLDLAAADPAPTQIISSAQGLADDRAQFGPAAARMVYSAATVSARGEQFAKLLLRDLATGGERVLREELESGDSYALAPDGERIAYLLEDAAGTTEVAIQRLPDGAPQIIGRGFWPQTRQMFWSADSQWLLMPIAGGGLQTSDAATLLIWRASDGELAHQIQLPAGWSLLSRQSPSHFSPVQISAERLVALASDQRRVLLIDVEFAAPERIGYLALSPSANRLLWTR